MVCVAKCKMLFGGMAFVHAYGVFFVYAMREFRAKIVLIRY